MPSIVIVALGLEGGAVAPVVADALPVAAFAVSEPPESKQPANSSPMTSKPVNRETVIIDPLRALTRLHGGQFICTGRVRQCVGDPGLGVTAGQTAELGFCGTHRSRVTAIVVFNRGIRSRELS